MSAMLSDPVRDLIAAADKLRADDRLITSADQQLDEIEAIFEVLTTVQAVAVHRLRDASSADAPREATGRSMRGWLRDELFLSGADISRYLRCVRKLADHPLVEAALDTAAITLAHAVAIITALETLPPELRATLEPGLVEHAKFNPPEAVAGFVDALLDALGIDKAGDVRRERRYADRGVDLHTTLDGTRSLAGTLTPEVGAELARALALAARPCGSDDDRTPRQRAHDALGEIASAYLAAHETPSFTGAPRTAIITMPLETLEDSLRDGWVDLPDGAKISAATARRLACDAELIPAVLGSRSEILDIGQANREFTVAQRRAAYLRDDGKCAFPDCRGKVAELHHIWFHRRGGPGTLDNAAWICRFHHWLVHEGSWTLRRDPADKSYVWTGPHGRQRVRHLHQARPPGVDCGPESP